MKQFKKSVSVVLVTLTIFGMLVNFTLDKKGNSSLIHSKESLPDSMPPLISLNNLVDFYYDDSGYDITTLSQHMVNQKLKDKSFLDFLSAQLDSLPLQAWENYRNKLNSYEIRAQLYENGTFEDSIVLKNGNTIEEFLPELWYQVSSDSGYITGIDNVCFVAGYNTPVKNNDGYNFRCLAVYEYRNGRYRLIKQTFGAIENFIDSDDDLLFDRFDETNFYLSIEGGNIFVNHEYMRGGSYYEFAHTKGNWILVSNGSGHRTCCQSESVSYDYRTRIYTSSVFSMSDDEESEDFSGDTTITIIQDRPIIYMDSLNYREYDYE